MSAVTACPWLSIIMPTYNGAAFLGEALDSLLAQSCKDFEIVVVDDQSSDRTVEIIDRYAGRLPITIIPSSHTGSWTQNTNLALSSARGIFLSILHQDDTWDSRRVEKIKTLSLQAPEATLLVHRANFIADTGKVLGQWSCPFDSRLGLLDPAYILEKLFVQNFIAVPAVTVRRDLVVSLGGLDPILWYTGDWDLWLKCARKGNWLYLNESLAGFRVHAGSQTIVGAECRLNYVEQYSIVYTRHSQEVLAHCSRTAQIFRLAQFSNSVNLFLLAAYQGKLEGIWSILLGVIKIGPLGLYRYFQISRILERLGARLLLFMLRKKSPRSQSAPSILEENTK